jgi:hypothetical protein
VLDSDQLSDALSSGYPLDHSPAAILASADSNQLVFVATVVAVGNPNEIGHAPDVAGLAIPITVKVTEVLKG